MEFNNQNGAHVQNGTAKEPMKPAQNGAVKKDAVKSETPKPEPVKPEQPKGEEPKQVQPAIPAIIPVLTLESTLKVVDDLHRRSIQRVNLISRIKQLETFEVQLVSENDELEENPYQGCKLIIEDDKQRRFVTTTPGLIRLVSQFIFTACHEKLVLIEAAIVFPKA